MSAQTYPMEQRMELETICQKLVYKPADAEVFGSRVLRTPKSD